MKHLMENWREFLKEEKEREIISEDAWDSIKTFFGQHRDETQHGSYDEAGIYDPNTWGAFAQANQVIAQLMKAEQKVSQETFVDTLMKVVTLGGASAKEGKTTAQKMAPIVLGGVGALAGIVGAPIVAGAATAAGLGGLIAGAIKAAKDDPTKAQKVPMLSHFNIDPQWREILDDKLETELEEAYVNKFMDQLSSDPNSTMQSLDDFIRETLPNKYDNRNVTKP